MNDFSRNISFISTTADYELLTDSNIKRAIKDRLGITNDASYNSLLANGISNMGFCVFANTRISINGETYENNEPLFNVVSGNGEINYNSSIKSIKVEDNNISGMFYFRIA